MKTRLLLSLVGLAIGFALPAFAQEQKTVSPEVRQQIEAVLTKFDEAFNRRDEAALADLYTQDAVEIWPWEEKSGAALGQQAIAKRHAIEFASGSSIATKLVQVYPIGNDICAITAYTLAMHKGYHVTIYVRDADTWKIRMVWVESTAVP